MKKPKKRILWLFPALAALFFIISAAPMSGQKAKEKRAVIVEKERSEFKALIQKNKNYFGTFSEFKLSPVIPMKFNVKYEEVLCLGLLPEEDLLQAVLSIKLPCGYKGDLCSAGSMEYVRFFVDWNGNGAFEASEDAGMGGTNVHDIPNVMTACLDKTKPLSAVVSLRLDPKKLSCKMPNLVKARAILSWDYPPDAGNPAFIPVWGNTIDRWIQIEPEWPILAKVAKKEYLKDLKIDPEKVKLEKAEEKPQALTVAEIKDIYQGTPVSELRFNLNEIVFQAEKVKADPALLDKLKADLQTKQLAKSIDMVLKPNPSVQYEELGCVGLQYDLEQLVATLKVKLPYGFCGDLCKAGSTEYVGFWAYETDPIEQMCHWNYLGTAQVGVHDIPRIPAEGLHYSVVLPADFSRLRQDCKKPVVVKIRAILSWNTPPTNADYKPVWGNRAESLIQIRPLPPGQTAKQVPFISQVGNMPVAGIEGNTLTVEHSSLVNGDGYANGPSILGSFTADECPFGGLITVNGRISFAPDDPASDAARLKYKMQHKKVSGGNWKDIENDFWIVINKTADGGVTWLQTYLKQKVDGGYYTYYPDWEGNKKWVVEGEVLAQWWTPVFEGDGLYKLRALLLSPGAPADPALEIPAGHVGSNVIQVMVDNTVPDLSLTVNLPPGTNCGKFPQSSIVKGTYSATDKHFSVFGFSLLPDGFPAGSFKLTPPSPEVVPSTSVTTYPWVVAPGIASGTFSLDTAGLTPCGYVIYLEVWDRTIHDNHWDSSLYGNHSSTSKGLCVIE